jgi:peptidoglycan/LPS O-acetylase OafA/YrhL
MLIQFYLLFPLLFWAARRLGPWAFLLAACAVGILRALPDAHMVYPQNGMWILGGFAISRPPEFALGMALGTWHSRSTARVERFLLGGAGLATGLLLYPAALQLYHNGYTYIFVDFATGTCCFGAGRPGRNYFALPIPGQGIRLGRSCSLTAST